MADLMVNTDAVYALCQTVARASQSVQTLVEVPRCDDVEGSAAWRLLMLQLGRCVSEVAADLQTLSDGAYQAMTAYQVTEGELTAAAASERNHRRGERG